jgi:hypothetical protein
MKRIAAFVLLIFPLISFAQKMSEQRFQIGVNFSTDICFRSLSSTDGSSINNVIIDQRNDWEIPKFGFTTGLNVMYTLNNHFSLESGVQYSNKGYQTSFLFLHSGQLPPSVPEQVKYIYNYNYLDIPLRLNYVVGKKKIRFISSVGIATNVFLNYKQTNVLVYADRTEKVQSTQDYDFKRFNLSPTISAGVDYKINDMMSLRLETIFRYGVLNIIDAPVTAHLFNGGLNISYFIGL